MVGRPDRRANQIYFDRRDVEPSSKSSTQIIGDRRRIVSIAAANRDRHWNYISYVLSSREVNVVNIT